MLFVIMGALFVPISINPWIIIPLVVLFGFLFVLQKIFITTGRGVKRMDNIGYLKCIYTRLIILRLAFRFN
jgi:hypothetical protein